MLCTNCGANIADGDIFCQSCGQKVIQEQPISPEQPSEPEQPSAPEQPSEPEQPSAQEQTMEQPVAQPVAQPIKNQPVQPAYQQPVQPFYQQPTGQPIYGQPGGQPSYTPPMQQPMGQPGVQPIYGQPVQPTPYTRQPMPQTGYIPPMYNQPIKRHRGKGCLIALGIVIVIIVAAILCLIYLLPGFFSPRDLGIKSSKSAYESAMTKLGYDKDDAPTGSDPDDYNYIYGPLHDVDTALNSEELTSFFNYNRPKYYALKNVQIRVNSDDTMEMSGSLDLKYFLDEILGGEYTQEQIEEKMPMLGILPHKINIYCKVSGEINNNKAEDFVISDIEVQGFGVPKSLYKGEEAEQNIENVINSTLSRVTEKNGSSYNSVKIDDGQLILNALLPSSLVREEIN